jgi:phosphotransferase system HPr (HPr) family protein
MIKELKITKKDGLKAEDCAVICTVASTFESNIFLIKAKKKVNAKSIVGVISLNIKKDDVVHLSVSGIDEEAAFAKLLKLF